MGFTNIPLTQNLPWYEFGTVLAGTRFVFEVRYNIRIDRWFLTIKDATGALILAGVPLLINRPLLSQYPTLPLPQGAMFVYDTTRARTEPGLSSFLLSHKLYFYTDDSAA